MTHSTATEQHFGYRTNSSICRHFRTSLIFHSCCYRWTSVEYGVNTAVPLLPFGVRKWWIDCNQWTRRTRSDTVRPLRGHLGYMKNSPQPTVCRLSCQMRQVWHFDLTRSFVTDWHQKQRARSRGNGHASSMLTVFLLLYWEMLCCKRTLSWFWSKSHTCHVLRTYAAILNGSLPQPHIPTLRATS